MQLNNKKKKKKLEGEKDLVAVALPTYWIYCIRSIDCELL